MNNIGMMYITIIPPIIAGVFNMVFCKAHFLRKLQNPIDCKKNFIDGRRIFGDNKTWKGLLGYIVINTFIFVIWGIICNVLNINKYNFFYVEYNNTFLYNIIIGLLLGLGYSLFELPNSFLKRRLDIVPGKTANGIKKFFFVFLDQADSAFGCCLVISMFYKMSIVFYFLYVLLCAITHIIINILLYFMKLRKNMF